MSWQAQTAVNHHSKQANLGLFRLLLYLAEGANENGLIDPAPSQQTTAAFYGCDERTIRNRIGRLIDSGELKQVRVGSGPGNPSAYQICLPMPPVVTGDDKGGKMAETNAGFISTITELKAELKAEIFELKAEILAAKAEIFELKAEKVETKGGKGGNQRRKAHSFKNADDPLRSKNTEEEEEEDSPLPPAPADNPFPFKPSPARPAVTSPAQERVNALIAICGLDPDIPDHVRQAENTAAQLGKKYTADDLRKRYAYQDQPNGTWYWYRDDFRGERGDMPTLKNVVETVAKERKPAAEKNGRASTNPAASPPDDDRKARIARMINDGRTS